MLRIGQQLYDAIRQHGEETWPDECCGVLLGHFASREAGPVTDVEDAVRTTNARTDSAQDRYQIAPQELVRIQRASRERGLDIVGFYHSHPDHPAQWSPTDLAEAHWIGCSYVITAVEGGAARQTNSFLLTGTTEEDKAFARETIEIAGQLDPGLEPAGKDDVL